MDGKAAIRAKRTARAIPGGQEILDLLQATEVRAAILAAAEAGHPPVAAVSQRLIDAMGLEAVRSTPVKMFVGLCISAILEADYNVFASRVRLSKDPLFSTGTVYKRRADRVSDEPTDMLERFLMCLQPEEADRAIAILTARRGKNSAATRQGR